jgi:hypothetical protein
MKVGKRQPPCKIKGGNVWWFAQDRIAGCVSREDGVATPLNRQYSIDFTPVKLIFPQTIKIHQILWILRAQIGENSHAYAIFAQKDAQIGIIRSYG